MLSPKIQDTLRLLPVGSFDSSDQEARLLFITERDQEIIIGSHKSVVRFLPQPSAAQAASQLLCFSRMLASEMSKSPSGLFVKVKAVERSVGSSDLKGTRGDTADAASEATLVLCEFGEPGYFQVQERAHTKPARGTVRFATPEPRPVAAAEASARINQTLRAMLARLELEQ